MDGSYSLNSCSSCIPTNIVVELIDAKTNANYVIENNLVSSDIRIVNDGNQQLSSNISITNIGDLKSVLRFALPHKSDFVLKIRNNISIKISYTSQVSSKGTYELSNFKVDGTAATATTVSGDYLLKVKI